MQAEVSENTLKCVKCDKTFTAPSLLRRHLTRKTPCDPIVAGTGSSNDCRYCGKGFASRPSMNRHIRNNCKIANTEEGMDRLVTHTLQRQINEQANQINEQTNQMKEQSAQLAKLTAIIEQIATEKTNASPTITITNNVQTTQNNVQTNHIAITPWDGGSRLGITAAQMAAAFVENSRLREYMRLPEHQLTDPELAPPFVAEMFVDLVKRGHADPASRNVYMNPRRADQAIVLLQTGKWEVISLEEAARHLLEGVSQQINRVVLNPNNRDQLSIEAQNALSMAEMVYSDEPEAYTKRTKGPLAAHLTNTAPSCITVTTKKLEATQ